MLLVGHLNLKCASIWLGNENVKLTVFPVKLLHNWLAQLLVVHQLTCDYRPCFPGICDATNALLIYAVIWTFISNSVDNILIQSLHQILIVSVKYNIYFTKLIKANLQTCYKFLCG